MASLQLSSASDMSAEVTTLTDFLRNEVNDDENEILQTTGQLCSLLSTIDTLRVKAHELLEAETISASKLRFKLNTLQQTFEVELAGATEAARAYLALQKRNEEMCIHEVNAAKAEARRKQSELELESRDLAQRIMSRERKYREQVSDVNEIMTNRSKVKISLNETEAELQSVLGKTQQCEQNRLRLQERAKESLNEFVMDMNGLSTSLEEVKKALACENEKKRHLSRKCDEIEEDVIRAKNKMEIAEKVLSDAVSRLESEIDLRRELEVSIVEARKKAEELSKECVDIQEKCRSGRKNLHSEERQLAEQHRMMVKAVEEIRVEVDTLFAKHRKAQAALMKEMKLKDKHQSAVSNIRKSSTSAKEKLKYQSEKGAELQTENRNLDLQLKECSETSIIVKRQLQDQIEKLNDESEHKESLRMRLEKDTERLRQGILALESKLEGMATQLKDNEESNSHICSTSAKKISKLKSECRKAEQHIQVLNQTLSEGTTQLQSYVTTAQLQSQTLQENIETLEDSVSNKVLLIEALEPVCSGLEDEHARKLTVYDEEKESILSMRNHRTTLQDSAKRLRQQLKETIEKKEMMRMEIIHQRTRTKDHLKRQTLHSELNEAEVASTKQQLQAIVTENLHICEMAKDLQLECIWMREHQKRPKMDMAEVSRIRENLATQWSNDQKIEEEHRKYCDMILSKMELLSRQVEKRLKQLDHVYNERLSEEPETLAASHL